MTSLENLEIITLSVVCTLLTYIYENDNEAGKQIISDTIGTFNREGYPEIAFAVAKAVEAYLEHETERLN